MTHTKPITRPATRLLRRSEAAAYVTATWGFPCATRTLAKLVVLGHGPLYVKAGRIPLYDPADLDAWAASKITGKFSSTSVRVAA